MSVDLVTFNIRYENSLHLLQIQPPKEVSEFVQTLKNELLLENTDELIILFPIPEGKMMEIKVDDDIEFLMKNKLCYNAVTKEIYCNVELVVITLQQKLLDDPKVQMMILSNKVDQLSSQLADLSQLLDFKIEECTSNILDSMRSIILEQTDSVNKFKENNALDQKNSSTVPTNHPKCTRKKQTKKNENILVTSPGSSATNNDNATEDLKQQKNSIKSKDIDDLLEKLVKNGFTNTIQNIIVLKRFENDYEKAINYLKNTTS